MNDHTTLRTTYFVNKMGQCLYLYRQKMLFLPLGFGISFQLPLVMLLLERIGVFTIQTYLSSWRIAVLIIFVLAMFLTPADPVSMLLMALPLTMLFFGGIGLCKWLPKRSSPIGPGIEP